MTKDLHRKEIHIEQSYKAFDGALPPVYLPLSYYESLTPFFSPARQSPWTKKSNESI
jgi:hypothetical protein